MNFLLCEGGQLIVARLARRRLRWRGAEGANDHRLGGGGHVARRKLVLTFWQGKPGRIGAGIGNGVGAIVSRLLWLIDTIDVHCRERRLGPLLDIGHGESAGGTILFIQGGSRGRRSGRVLTICLCRLIHHDFNRDCSDRNPLDMLEDPEQKKQRNDDMARN